MGMEVDDSQTMMGIKTTMRLKAQTRTVEETDGMLTAALNTATDFPRLDLEGLSMKKTT
jgi:hypothetical protein